MAGPRRAEITAEFTCSRQRVWDKITDHSDISWRNDLRWVEEEADGARWKEYLDAQHYTQCILTQCQQGECYAYTMENDTMQGSWEMHLSDLPNGGCKLVIAREVQLRSAMMQVMSYFVLSLQGMLNQYVYALKRELGEKI